MSKKTHSLKAFSGADYRAKDTKKGQFKAQGKAKFFKTV